MKNEDIDLYKQMNQEKGVNKLGWWAQPTILSLLEKNQITKYQIWKKTRNVEPGMNSLCKGYAIFHILSQMLQGLAPKIELPQSLY